MTMTNTNTTTNYGQQVGTVPACTLCGGNCMECWHSDYCNAYNDIAPYDCSTVIVGKEGAKNE